MKTPRELLFEVHQDAQSKLDVRRGEVVARLRQEKAAAAEIGFARRANVWRLLWRELILPSQRTWAGIAAAWILILGVNFALRDSAPKDKEMMSAPPLMSFQEQQKLVNELLADRALPHDADRPKTAPGGPHSMRSVMVMT